jgi:Alpha/beta hydrolase of unknown function (DUF915)
MELEYILFVQHGWADDNRAMTTLAHNLTQGDHATQLVVPNLGYVQTWIRMEPLIRLVESIATSYIARYPTARFKIVGHSMGGLIWLELLNRHPDWWPRVHSLVLVASPVGGADLGRLIDPLRIGVGIAADLGKNRRAMAEQIAAQIPTLVIAGDVDGGSDGTVTVECTKVPHAWFVCLPGLSHPALRNAPEVSSTVHQFWDNLSLGERIDAIPVVQRLRLVPGMTDGHWRDFPRAEIHLHLKERGTLRLWVSPFAIHHVFVADMDEKCLYAGFVGWLHIHDLKQALVEIRIEHGM